MKNKRKELRKKLAQLVNHGLIDKLEKDKTKRIEDNEWIKATIKQAMDQARWIRRPWHGGALPQV